MIAHAFQVGASSNPTKCVRKNDFGQEIYSKMILGSEITILLTRDQLDFGSSRSIHFYVGDE